MHQNLQSHCLHCEEPLTGRADKKFCDSSCKARYHRTFSDAASLLGLPAASASASVLALALLAHPPHVVLYNGEPSEHNERYTRVRMYQEETDTLHTEYADAMEFFLLCVFDNFTFAEHSWYLKEVEQAAHAYRQHPGLLTPGHLAHHRLTDLHLLRYYLHSVGKQAEVKERDVTSRHLETRHYYHYLSERQVKHLWANLLGVA